MAGTCSHDCVWCICTLHLNHTPYCQVRLFLSVVCVYMSRSVSKKLINVCFYHFLQYKLTQTGRKLTNVVNLLVFRKYKFEGEVLRFSSGYILICQINALYIKNYDDKKTR